MTNLQVECFLAVAECGSFTAAAQSLYRSVQSVTHQVSTLEQELGTTLLLRSYAGVELTPAGELYHTHFRGITNRYHRMLAAIQETYREMSRRFAIGFSDRVDPYGEIRQGIDQFYQEHPGTQTWEFQYDNRRLLQALDQRELDVAIMPDTQIFVRNDYEVKQFVQEKLCLYAPETAARRDDPDPLGDVVLCGSPYGAWSPLQWREFNAKLSQRYLGFRLKHSVDLPNYGSVLSSVENFCGAAVCDARLGYLEKVDGLERFPIPMESFAACVWRKDNENPLISAFYQVLKSCFSHS